MVGLYEEVKGKLLNKPELVAQGHVEEQGKRRRQKEKLMWIWSKWLTHAHKYAMHLVHTVILLRQIR